MMPDFFSSNIKKISFIFLKIILNTLVIVVFYTNFAIFFNFTPWKFKLPINRYAYNSLYIYSVFSGYVPVNRDCVIKIFVEDKNAPGHPEWERVDTLDYFPFTTRGALYFRFRANFHQRRFGNRARLKAYAFAGKKIKERYNRLNPDKKALKVEMGIDTWPASRRSYYELKIPEFTKYWAMYSEDRSMRKK